MTDRFRRPRGLTAVVAALALAAGSLTPLSQAFAQQGGGMPLVRDTEIEEILHKDADPVFRAAGFDPRDVRIVLMADNEINAFATTGGNLGMQSGQVMAVYSGLILKTAGPNELIGVMAHETGHLAGGHAARSDEMNNAGMKPFLLTMGLGVLAALAGAGDAAGLLVGSASYFGTLGAIGYSREQEARADQAAVGFLEASGQSAEGLVTLFDQFRYQEVFAQSRRFKYFQDHPLSSDRIDALRVRVEAQPHFNVKDTPEAIAEHEIMKAKLDGFINPQASLVKYSEKDTGFPARYARAIAYYQTHEPDRAIKIIDGLLQEQPNNPYLYELKGQILFEFGRAKEAEAPQRKSVELKPNAPLLRINLGQTLVGLDDPAKVAEGVQQLKLALGQETDNAIAWRVLAQAYDKQGDGGEARLATAEEYFSMGATQEARSFAMRARQILPKDTPSWRRATDIVLVSKPTDQDLRELANPG